LAPPILATFIIRQRIESFLPLARTMQSRKASFYAVQIGRTPGVYLTWEDCERQIKGWPYARYKKFPTKEQADAFVESSASSETAAPSTDAPQIPDSATSEETNDASSAPVSTIVPPPDPSWTTVYTDGACKGNGGPESTAGIGVWWGPDDSRNLSERCPGAQTNNRAELIAIIRALESFPSEQKLLLRSDSKYATQCVTDWLPNWREHGFKTSNGSKIANLELILYLEALMERKSPGTIRLEWVAGHSGDVGNDAADNLATAGCLHQWRPEEEDEWDVTKLEEDKATPSKHEDENIETMMQFSVADVLADGELKELERTLDF